MQKSFFIFLLFLTTFSYSQNEKGVVINGVTWATCNVDKPKTFATSYENAGKFYQWNRKKAWNTTELSVKSWKRNIYTQRDTTWQKKNDPCPKGWRVPTFDEIKTLLDSTNVIHKWVKQNGINGTKFIDKNTENSIFLPAIGFRHNSGVLQFAGFGENTEGCYWSNGYRNSKYAHVFVHFYINDNRNIWHIVTWSAAGELNGGFSVRCVKE